MIGTLLLFTNLPGGYMKGSGLVCRAGASPCNAMFGTHHHTPHPKKSGLKRIIHHSNIGERGCSPPGYWNYVIFRAKLSWSPPHYYRDCRFQPTCTPKAHPRLPICPLTPLFTPFLTPSFHPPANWPSRQSGLTSWEGWVDKLGEVGWQSGYPFSYPQLPPPCQLTQ